MAFLLKTISEEKLVIKIWRAMLVVFKHIYFILWSKFFAYKPKALCKRRLGTSPKFLDILINST